jgi:quercetin dioxygenase-like cupin family protein
MANGRERRPRPPSAWTQQQQKEGAKLRLKVILVVAGTAVVVGAGAAIASHSPEIDPATVPTGFFVAHNHVADFPVSPIARAVNPDGTDVFVQHLSLGANQVFAWHTHPGPVVVTVRSGSLTYQDAGPNACRNRTYTAGQGFVDPGFGHVHRVIAGPSGAEIYSTFFLPPGSANHLIVAPAAEECS